MKLPDTIIISPVGEIPSWVSSAICENVAKNFGFKSRVESVLQDISFAYDEKRDQYYSTQILEELAKIAPEECVKLLAVTKEDLFIPILTHVYGEAQLGGIASIVSIARLEVHPVAGALEQGQQRMIKEAAHEIGHSFDLRHCDDPLCIMHYCRKIEDVDHKSENFCRYCSILLSDSIKLLSQ